MFFRKMDKKLSFVLALLMVLGLLVPASVLGASSDIGGHWAEDVINQWVDEGLAGGYGDGTFRPNDPITRAEFMSFVNRAFGFEDEGNAPFTDVPADAWYAPVIRQAMAAGYLEGYPDGTVRPNNSITRQEATVIITKVLDLEADMDELDRFTDSDGIPAWSRSFVSAVVKAGFMSGYPDGTFGAVRNITRAESLVTLHNARGYTPPVGDDEEEPTAVTPATLGSRGIREKAAQMMLTVSVVFSPEPRINSENWIADSEVEIEITREGSSVFEHQAIADGEGDINVYIPGLKTTYKPMGGDLLTMTDNHERYVEYEILFISVAVVDVEANTVSGLADPSQEVEVYLDTSFDGDSYDEMPRKIVVADGDGEWIADFTGDYDLWEGLYGGAMVYDENGNNSIHYWDSSIPHVTVFPHDNCLCGYAWLDEVTVTVTVYGTEDEYPYTIETDNGWFDFTIPMPVEGVDITAGDEIEVTDGVTTYTFVVAELELVSVDRSTGDISGTAEPNSEVILDISTPWMQPGGGPPTGVVYVTLTVDDQGEWSYEGDPIDENDDIYVIVESEEYGELVRTAVRHFGVYSSPS